jgi:hypothetical protein
MTARTRWWRSATALASLALMAAVPAGKPSLKFTAVAGVRHYTGGGPGRCGREAEASLYQKPAALYLIEYAGGKSGDLKHVRLTLWQFKDGSPDQLSLAFDAGRDFYNISTLEKSKIVGKGSATVTTTAAGGKIVVKGQDARGVPIQMTVECDAFEGIEAEGG